MSTSGTGRRTYSWPLSHWWVVRREKVTDRRTKLDFAQVIRELVDEQDPETQQVVLVLDNLNTHKMSNLY